MFANLPLEDMAKEGFGREAMNAHRASLGLPPLPLDGPDHGDDVVPEPPDVPSCETCGKDFSANFSCSQCQLAWYCSKACQKIAWKQNGHKQACAGMKEKCHNMAQTVVSQMANTASPPILRVQGLDRLDLEGPYRIAQEQHNLHQVIYDMLLDDKQNVQKRFVQHPNQPMQHVSYAQWIMTSLFRGGRVSQMTLGSTANRYCDAYRVKQFVLSQDDALEVWWDASMTFVTKVVMDRKLFQRHKPLHAEAHHMARNIVATWGQVLTSRKAAKAILYHKEKGNPEKAAARATYLATSTKETLKGLNETRDLQSVLEGLINQNLAMIHYWCHQWNVPVNIEQLAGFHKDSLARKMYRNMAKPAAQATILKGSKLTTPEFQRAMGMTVDW